MSDLKDRFQQISDYKDVSIRKLEEFFSLNRGNISNISVNGAIGSDKLAKIIDKIPELSIEWLLTGKGEMLKAPKESPASPNLKDEHETPEYKEKYYNLLEENRELRLRIEKQDELTKALKQEIIELKQSTIKSKNTDSVLPVRLPKNKATVQEHQQ